MNVPASAKRKVIKPRNWEGPTAAERVVYIDDVTAPSRFIDSTRRVFDVYSEDGAKLGRIEGDERSITTKIKGTRLVRHGKRRMLWNVVGESWNDQESAAAAVRELLRRQEP